MEFAKGVALLRHFKRPLWSRSKPKTLKQKRPYIVPTGFGFIFGTLAVIQLIMAVASQNNLIYLFVFSEISIALASMFFTNLNIHRTEIKGASTSSCFANEDNWVEVTVQSEKPVYQLYVKWTKVNMEPALLQPSSTVVQIPWKPRQRGLQDLPAITVESSYPFGLLRSWKIERLPTQILVYPERKGSHHFPQEIIGDQAVDNQGLFFDLKVFQRGDWPRRIDWRASQRSQQLLIRRYEEDSAIQLDFNWLQTRKMKDFESRISQLALWVDTAEKQGAQYSLRVGSWYSGRARGPHHWTKCFDYLATLEKGDLP